MKYLTHKAKIQCIHGGEVKLNPPGKRSLTINGEAIVCKEDLENATILNCPVPRSQTSKPCEKVIALLMGQSRGVEVNGKTPLLQTVMALSDCLPAPGLCSAVNDGNSVMQIKLPGVNLDPASPAKTENPAKTTSNTTAANNTTNNQASVVPTKDKIFQPDSNKTGWFELILEDDLNKALEGEWVRLIFPDQKVYDNVLDKQGKISVKGTPTGTCKVYFPNLKDRWPPEPNPKKLDYLELVTNKPHKLTIESTDWFTDIIPIIILPGITGTRLIDPDTGKLIFNPPWPYSSGGFAAKVARLKQIENPLEPAINYYLPFPSGEKFKTIINFLHCVTYLYDKLPLKLIENSFIEEIKNNFKGKKDVKEVRVHFFGYDWRQDCSTHANELDDLINKVLQQTVAKKVIIIAHSMGGLVSRYYCCAKQPETGKAKGEDKIKALILVGSPTHGAPKAYRLLKEGIDSDEDLAFRFLFYDEIPSAGFLRHFPSIYQLLPTNYYCKKNSQWLPDFESRHPDNNITIGNQIINTKEPSFVYGNNLCRTSGLTIAKLVDNNLKIRETFDQTLGSSMPDPKKITTHIIYSVSHHTEVKYELEPLTSDLLKKIYNSDFKLKIFKDAGDATVPVFSARADGCNITGERVSIDDKEYKHAELLNSPKVIKEVKRLIFKELGLEISPADREVKPKKEQNDIFERHIFLEYIAHHIVYEPKAIEAAEHKQILTQAGYDIHKIYWEEGLYGFQACVLLPNNSLENSPNPILAIRGTYSIAGVSTDLDFFQVGHNQFKYNEKKIENLLNKTNKKVDITGHSLGGAVAQITASHKEFYSRIDNVVTFQAPGINYFTYNRFNNISEQDPPTITHHIVSGDIVDLAGGFRLPGIIYEHNHPRPANFWNPNELFKPHEIFVFATDEFQELRKKVGLKDEFIKNILNIEIRSQSIGYNTYYSDPYLWRRKIIESGRGIISLALTPITYTFDMVCFLYDVMLSKVVKNIEKLRQQDIQKLQEVKATYIKEGFSEKKAEIYAAYDLGYIDTNPEELCRNTGIK